MPRIEGLDTTHIAMHHKPFQNACSLDCCPFSGTYFYPLKDFTIALTNSTVCKSRVDNRNLSTCASDRNSLNPSTTYTYLCSSDTRPGRFLFIQSQNTEYRLFLGEVEAYELLAGTFQPTYIFADGITPPSV